MSSETKYINSDYKDLLCSKTGRLAENTMKDNEGNIYWQKAVQFYELEDKVTPCDDTCMKIKNLLKYQKV